MNIPILYEKIHEQGFPEGYYYAHIPTLNLTTHGLGIEGAKSAAGDLIKLWLDEKTANNEPVNLNKEYLFSTIEM
ncbi:MAG: hypothetical protein EPN82_09380 [Bacteroidetes bacterium]|nr:MAG: hypothetical protein EPN82_09380 [Bacteroidota bacterium]